MTARVSAEQKALWKEMRARAIELRRRDQGYEQIAKTISDEHEGYGLTPWWVYSQCHPEKSAAQIRAWQEKHHPGVVLVEVTRPRSKLSVIAPTRGVDNQPTVRTTSRGSPHRGPDAARSGTRHPSEARRTRSPQGAKLRRIRESASKPRTVKVPNA